MKRLLSDTLSRRYPNPYAGTVHKPYRAGGVVYYLPPTAVLAAEVSLEMRVERAVRHLEDHGSALEPNLLPSLPYDPHEICKNAYSPIFYDDSMFATRHRFDNELCDRVLKNMGLTSGTGYEKAARMGRVRSRIATLKSVRDPITRSAAFALHDKYEALLEKMGKFEIEGVDESR